MHILWVLLTVPAVVTTVQGQRPLACDSVGDGSPVCSCRSGRVSCEDADLTDVPTDIPPDTGTLELTGNKITSLPELVFDDLPQVSTLDLSDNEIASIEVGAFDGLGGSLSKLDLNNNELVSLEDGILRNLTSLVYLYLKDNKISTIPERITKSSFKTMHILWVLLTVPAVVTTVQGQRPLACDSVGDGSPVCSCRSGRVSCEDADLTDVPTDIPPDTGTLELSGNKITSLPALVFDGLPEVTTLDLSNNEIASIEVGAFDGLGGSLRKLDLNNNELVSLEDGILRNLTSLVYLYLKDNKISTVSSEVFRGLSSLLQIFFDGNRISSFHVDTFSDLPSLYAVELPRNRIRRLDSILPALPSRVGSIDLSGNNLGNIGPAAFNRFPTLSSLNLKSCNISVVSPDAFVGLEFLGSLYFDENDLVELKNNMFGTHEYSSLAILRFNDNKIKTIEAGFFNRFRRLAYIQLKSNNLASLPPGVFANLSRLEELLLNDNKFESLDDPNIFRDLQSIRTLELQENNLKSLPSGIFSESNLPKLKTLGLHYNALTEIENGTFDNLPNINTIYLQYNPLKNVSCGMIPSKGMSASLEMFTVSCTCDIEPLYDCPEFGWFGYNVVCLSPIWVWRVPLNYTSPDRWGWCSGAGFPGTNWIALAVLLLLSNLFISN
uniref:LRRNT domain-containing protein n=1 Tax=Branchiostoma floridae TaxID=7739 RepID=C3YSM7_BRAFL|eukprot:XP_002600716.1 hypothetical protein BRAFLDRAFT_83458 [Branchiostoma floridae]